MGWTIHVHVVRDHALRASERKALAAHARRAKLRGYDFLVAPLDSPAGVIAIAGGKLARTPDPEEDADAARLFAALTELRSVIVGATIEIADDLHLVGWDGDRVDLVRDPVQELTKPPADLTAWEVIPPARAPRTVKPKAAPTPISALKLPPPLASALAAILDGTAYELAACRGEDEIEAADAVLGAITRAHKPKESDAALCAGLATLARALPAQAVVTAGLARDRHLADGAAVHAIGEALGRMTDLAPIRDRLLDVWLGPAPARSPDAYWDRLGWRLLPPVACDPVVVARLGDELDRAVHDERTLIRRHMHTRAALARTHEGVARLIRRRRHDRAQAQVVAWSYQLISSIASSGLPEAVPTLLLELAHGLDRDELLTTLARFDDPQILPLFERALATDQYTRQIAFALLSLPGEPATALLEQLVDHVDPLVRIRAAQGLVARRGTAAVPGLVAAIVHARAAGIWRHDHPPGQWSNEQFRRPEDALAAPFSVRAPWPTLAPALLDVPDPVVEPSSSTARMRSMNPDVRRDAIELAHEEALAARDASSILRLVHAEQLHRALCDAAQVPHTTMHGSCSRVNVTNYWSSPVWRRLAKLPFDPMYKYDSVTWAWLGAHAAEAAPQVVPPELADVPTLDAARVVAAAAPDRRLGFERSELARWDAEEQRNASPSA